VRVWQLALWNYLSQKISKEYKKVGVEEVAKSTSPCPEHLSAWCKSNKTLFVLQGEESVGSAPSEATPTTTVTFEDDTVGDLTFAADSKNPVAEVDATSEVGLSTFLQRPVVINTFTWSTSDPIGVKQTIQPWLLFLQNSAVTKKINNFAFLRAKLHIKVVINATPFQYGLLRVAYTPLLGLAADKVRTNLTSDTTLRVPYSQQPGIYIEPQLNAGGEMELPFFYHKNWLNITSANDVSNFGSLNYVIFAPLDRAIATASSALTVQTFAWMTDVELMAPTSKLALQGDEYGQGPVSGVATAVANTASYLTRIPLIGRFARATQIGASSVSRIASLFGYTNVPNIDNVQPMYVMSAPHLATAEISTPYQKLVLDPKTELSIDPEPFGIHGQDELSLSYIRRKESFFGATGFSTTQAVGTIIFNARVTPTLNANVTLQNASDTTVGYRTYHTPLSYLGNLFKHWRGTLKVRIKAVCTKYHKGRLKISYDPVNNISTSSPPTNEVYTYILDLSETNEITIEIPYHQALAWLSVGNSQVDDWNLGDALAPREDVDNGSISVSVFNTLESPSTPSNVPVLMYISGGDDFEFANPQSWIGNGGTSYVPSFFSLQGEESNTITFGTPARPHADRFGLNFGESILSLRKLMHRSQIMDTIMLPNSTGSGTTIYKKGYLRMPYTPGYTPQAMGPVANKVIAASGSADYAFNTMHMLPWISGMYQGYRGSTNFTVTLNSPQNTVGDMRVVRVTDFNAINPTNRWIGIAGTLLASANVSTRALRLNELNMTRDGLAGAAITSSGPSPSLQFSIPDNNNRSFSLVSPAFYIEGSSVDGTDETGAILTLIAANTTSADSYNTSTLSTAVGAGPDFTCLYFLCCPVVDYLLGDPTTP
jgi:hypothetical protein